MKRTCSGYRHQSNLTFRDETTRTREKFQQWQSRSHRPYPRSASNSAFSVTHATDSPVSDYNDCMNITYQLSTTTEDFATCHFYHATLGNLSDQDPSRNLHAQLPGLYAKCGPSSALCLATKAISLAASSKLLQEATQLSRKRYVQAIKAVRNALPDQQEATNDETLYAILLLCGYEGVFSILTALSYYSWTC